MYYFISYTLSWTHIVWYQYHGLHDITYKIECRYNAVQCSKILHTSLQWQRLNTKPIFNVQKTHPNGRSMVSFARMLISWTVHWDFQTYFSIDLQPLENTNYQTRNLIWNFLCEKVHTYCITIKWSAEWISTDWFFMYSSLILIALKVSSFRSERATTCAQLTECL